MAKNKTATESTGETPTAVATPATNNTLVYRRDHPGNRCSYGIAGVSGIVVFDKGLFLDGVAPPTIEMDCALALPKADNKQAKAEAQAAKLAEKAQKAADKLAAQQAKAAERQAKADAALAAAKAKVEAAAAKTAAPAEAVTQ